MNEENPLIDNIKSITKDAVESDIDFYCALEDDLNEKWVNDKLKKQKGLKCEVEESDKVDSLSNSDDPYEKSDFKTDAVLSCPSCLTIVCYESQRHETYKNQYRAMFAQSVTIDFDKKLFFPLTGKKISNTMSTEIPENASMDDIFYPVNCACCKHQIGVYDNEEVYHFFEVVTGY
ncbi:E2F-associated phosphoprotein [Strongyloides ratti]|uniref:E2F-associated phosphoprotein n=1 Tax=Strongyloides ratti TaxID=34506 RepID=A0A090L7L5_STRRB|nr:E2F-associated phosphoprotein [Strongyloides ratti]CEF65697.1 E2F-associated phosphoprotein [Strongyloides ratti]